MKQLKNVKKFTFEAAQYYVNDGLGDAVVLLVDYKNNHFSIEEKGHSPNPAFRRDIAQIAADLLRRKHGVDFSGKVSGRDVVAPSVK